MKLTKTQIDWVHKEQEILRRIDDSNPDLKSKIDLKIKWEALGLIIQLHNVQVAEEKRVKEKLLECKSKS